MDFWQGAIHTGHIMTVFKTANVFCVALALLCSAMAGYGGPRWISVSTSHFEMYTDNSEKEAERSLQGFEQVRYFFLQNGKGKQLLEGKVRIVAFSTEKEFKPFRPNPGTFAYYQQSRERDYIVMQDINPEHHEAAFHEYTHLIIQHMKLKIPVWLDEGMAELYSSLEPKGAQAMVGRPLANHILLLSNSPFMDWNVLFNVDHSSPAYNQPDKMHTFYAQSWILTHMLELGKGYQAGFPNFMAAVSSGMPTAEALEKVYGKSVEQVGKDVHAYVQQTTVRAALFDVKLSRSELDPEVAELPPFQTELALADLLSTRPDTLPAAQQRMLVLEQQKPENAELHESLGYLNWQQNNIEEARRHFGLAVEHGSKNATMIYQYGEMLGAANGSSETVIKLFERSLEMQPGNFDVRMALAESQINMRHFAGAMATLSDIRSVNPEQAYRFFAASAATRINLKDYRGAKECALKALKHSDLPDQRLRVTNMLDFIDTATRQPVARTETTQAAPIATRPEAEPAGENRPVIKRTANLPRVAGNTKSFECVRGGAYRLHLQAGDQEMVFAIPDPKQIVVRNTEGIEWNCGPLKPVPVTVVYKTGGSSAVAGVVAELIF